MNRLIAVLCVTLLVGCASTGAPTSAAADDDDSAILILQGLAPAAEALGRMLGGGWRR